MFWIRCGKLEEAKDPIQELTDPSASIFASLLSACSLQAAVGWWGDAERIRRMIDERGLRKFPEFSSISVTGKRFHRSSFASLETHGCRIELHLFFFLSVLCTFLVARLWVTLPRVESTLHVTGEVGLPNSWSVETTVQSCMSFTVPEIGEKFRFKQQVFDISNAHIPNNLFAWPLYNCQAPT
ncbi:hypothetical protein V6N12_025270 [Hibiscus sabdariffa]|uniref:Uncharacterized protein n=1 Tax=Hibiscus sabdariffa TaxID=183260 RepID=A0ABR2BM12_9ROSI